MRGFPLRFRRELGLNRREVSGGDRERPQFQSADQCRRCARLGQALLAVGIKRPDEMTRGQFVFDGIAGVTAAQHQTHLLERQRRQVPGQDRSHLGTQTIYLAAGHTYDLVHSFPVLQGVAPFKSNGSLYKNPNVAADVTVLLTGSVPGQSEPVAWVREKDGRRVFYTSLGHPDDFKDENFTRLLVNALAWATKTELKPAK